MRTLHQNVLERPFVISQQSLRAWKCAINPPDEEQVAPSATWKSARSLTFVSCPDWHSLAPLKLIWLTVLIMLIRNLMMMMRGFKSHSIASLECLCVLVGVVVRGGGAGGAEVPGTWWWASVCRTDKWWNQHAHRRPQVSLHAYLALPRFHLNLYQRWRGSIHTER